MGCDGWTNQDDKRMRRWMEHQAREERTRKRRWRQISSRGDVIEARKEDNLNFVRFIRICLVFIICGIIILVIKSMI